MSVSIKSAREIELMREAGKILGKVYKEIAKEIKAGVSTYTIDRIGEEIIRSYGCIPEEKGYQGYPASFCVSVNDQVVHGIPSKNKILRDGDIVSLDTVLSYKGYMADAARTYGVGEISSEANHDRGTVTVSNSGNNVVVCASDFINVCSVPTIA